MNIKLELSEEQVSLLLDCVVEIRNQCFKWQGLESLSQVLADTLANAAREKEFKKKAMEHRKKIVKRLAVNAEGRLDFYSAAQHYLWKLFQDYRITVEEKNELEYYAISLLTEVKNA